MLKENKYPKRLKSQIMKKSLSIMKGETDVTPKSWTV